MNKVELEIHALLLILTKRLLTYQSTIDNNNSCYQKLSKTSILTSILNVCIMHHASYIMHHASFIIDYPSFTIIDL